MTASSDEPDESLPRVFGRYVLLDRLSRGGMGEIYLARHGLAGFEKLLVIKKIRPNLAADHGFSSRFIDEAQLAVNLQQANIAQVFEVGRVEEEFFLALEHIDGRDLRRTLNKLGRVGGRLPVDLALFIAREAASGLAYAHRRTDDSGDVLDIVHCDISPPNVMMSFEGETKIIDFGIARSALRATATDPKIGWGKFGYMSPEQLMRGQKVDHRTDIYALGVILYEMLTGQRMYPVTEPLDYKELARKVNNGDHPLPSDFDKKLAPYDSIVDRAVESKREDRYQTAAEMRDDIQRALVTLRPTISGDDLGLFMRHLFSKERLAMKERLRLLEERSKDAQYKKRLKTAPPTVTFAVGDRFASATRQMERSSPVAAATDSAPSNPPWVWIAIASAVLLSAVLFIVLWATRGGDPAPTKKPKPVVTDIETPDGGRF